MRLVAIFLLLAGAVIVPFLIWGGDLDALIDTAYLQSFGRWAWLVGIVLLVGDLFLPIPATVVISGLGFLYGPVIGGLVGAAGSFLAGTLAYTLCRKLGHRAAVFIAGEDDLAKGERLFKRAGGWIVAVSRCLPVLPEIVTCMAGLVHMPARRFFVALACGSLPLGFVFASIGAAGGNHPAAALALSAAVPALLWVVARRLLHA